MCSDDKSNEELPFRRAIDTEKERLKLREATIKRFEDQKLKDAQRAKAKANKPNVNE